MSIFSDVCWPHICLLLKSVCSCPSPTFAWVCFFLVNLFQLFVDSGYQPFVRQIDCKNFLLFCGSPVHSDDSFFSCAEALYFNQIPFVNFGFCYNCFQHFSHEVFAYACVLNVLPRLFSRIFMVSGFTFKSSVYLELIFV